MTVCIAANVRSGNDHKIVVCTDRRVGGALGSAETALKDRYICEEWRLLTAGGESDINAMLHLYRKVFRSQAITYSNVDEIVKRPPILRKRILCEEYVQGKYAITYDEFLKNGKEMFPPDVHRDAIVRMSSIGLGVDLIVAGFASGSSEIYKCDQAGKVRNYEEFAVCGEGEYLASAALYRRSQDYMTSLEKTIYNVYEAKRYAEAVGSVGNQTSICVYNSDGSCNYVSYDAREELAALYKKYGPKELPYDLEYKSVKFLDSKIEEPPSDPALPFDEASTSALALPAPQEEQPRGASGAS